VSRGLSRRLHPSDVNPGVFFRMPWPRGAPGRPPRWFAPGPPSARQHASGGADPGLPDRTGGTAMAASAVYRWS